MNKIDNIEKKINELYKIHEESGLYNDSLENTLYKFTNAYDSLFLDEMRLSINKARKGQLLLPEEHNRNYDFLRHAYRACIKFAYESCKSGSFNQRCSRFEIEAYEQELEDTIDFNFIRNAIDRYRLCKYKVCIENECLHFTNIKGERSIIYDLYSRIFADKIPGGKDSKDNIDVFDFNVELIKQASGKQEFQSKKVFKPAKHILYATMNRFYLYFLKDLDINISFLKGKDYFFGQYLVVYCYLTAIAFYKTAYLLSLRGENDLINQPSLVYPKERLFADIFETTGLDEEIVKKVMDDMIYDYEFHKDKVTIFQPVFDFGEYYVCSCNMLFHSYIVDKAMKYFDLKGTNQPDLSVYHNYMSEKMNDRMAYNLPKKYPNLVAYKNCVLTIDDAAQAEIDLLVFDTNAKHAALIELKNYTPVENDVDALHKDSKINKAIKYSVVRDKRVLDNLKIFFKQNNIPNNYLNYEFSSLFVTNSYSGGVNVKESIKVVDEVLLYNLLSISGGDLKETIKSIETNLFFDIMEAEFKKYSHTEEHCYKGIKAKITNE